MNDDIEIPFMITCPHCGDSVLIEQINCRIFRHAVYKNTGEQMDPHALVTVTLQPIYNRQFKGAKV
jgi:hypothetical protein